MLSPKALDILADVISGGSANDPPETVIGIYRSATKLERFMRGCNVEFAVVGSRVPSLSDKLIEINRTEDAVPVLTRVIEAAADPRDFIGMADKQARVLEALNAALRPDGYEVRIQGGKARVFAADHSSPVTERLASTAEVIDFDTVTRDLNRALASAEADPEDAVTAASSVIESVCRSVLIALDLPLPAKKDISGLYRAVRGPLGLSPDRGDFPADIAGDIRQVLSGMITMIEGIGALRTHGGDAHGRERGFKTNVDGRTARLAIHGASTAALFIIETWQRKYPTKELRKAE